MLSLSAFDRTTAKLFVAAFFVLGGLKCIDLHAQEASTDSNTPAFANDYQLPDGDSWFSGWGATVGPSVQFPLTVESEYARGPHNVQPTTLPTLRYSWLHRRVQVSGVVFAEGQTLPRAKVDVVVVLEGGFSRHETVSTDGNGAYAATIQAPSRIASVSVNARNVCSTGDDKDCLDTIALGLSGVALSHSTPTAETTQNVDEAVDATTLF
ncbi:hypothetical protein ASG87_01635 [Frateuria sp. Soil773]|uniref:hypothetical protein n=1 Tax=Frateuria sp. Soil773 TaxID=1736407 RepID=UPI0006FF0E46|nr:hypothetical protein [Frateuria sp. Soil773]KRE90866.1 hypothetical protein ASG87_01635 [Frateuria sp. Soil773]